MFVTSSAIGWGRKNVDCMRVISGSLPTRARAHTHAHAHARVGARTHSLAHTPDLVSHDRVHEGGEEERVAGVRDHLTSLGHGAGHDRGRGGREHELEEESVPGLFFLELAAEGEVVVADERVLPSPARVAVGKTKPEKVEPTTVVDQMVVSEGSHGV